MAQLVHDRFMRLDGDRACDLATGAEVRLDAVADVVPCQMDTSLSPLVEALDLGRDGYPRWVIADARTRRQATSMIERVAAAAVQRGFVTISTELYLRFRDMLDAELGNRTLLLTGTLGTHRSRAHAALLAAASRSSRPHLLLTFGPASTETGPALVREARAAYAPRRGITAPPETPEIAQLIARASRARVFTAEGRHAAAERLLRDVASALARRRAFQPAARLTLALAWLLDERGRPEAAFAAFGEAARLAQCGQDDDLVVEARICQASMRIAAAAFLEAESICRAALAVGTLSGRLQTWARAVLSEALLWQGRIDDLPDVSASSELAALEAPVAAAVCEIDVRVLLAKGQMFDAGCRVELAKRLAEESADARVEVIAHTADLAVLGAAGDLARAAEALERVTAASRAARTPFRAAWARLTWIDALRRAGPHAAATWPSLISLGFGVSVVSRHSCSGGRSRGGARMRRRVLRRIRLRALAGSLRCRWRSFASRRTITTRGKRSAGCYRGCRPNCRPAESISFRPMQDRSRPCAAPAKGS